MRLPRLLALPLALAVSTVCSADPLNHPILWASASERASVLEKIENHAWARDFSQKFFDVVDPHLEAHKKNPATVLEMVLEIGADFQEHDKVLRLARNAGLLYYLTEDEAYAQMAADILAAYAEQLAPMKPEETRLSGGSSTDSQHFVDSRTGFPAIAIAYDFIHPFLIKADTTVLDRHTGERRPFDNAEAQRMMHNIAVSIVAEHSGPDKHGRTVSNHPILTAPGALYAILCLEDEAERERLFHLFWEKGTHEQASFKNTILPLYTEQGIWPETVSYGFMPPVTMVLNIIDRVKPELGVIQTAHAIMEGSFIYPNLRYPDGTWARYGDSKRKSGGGETLLRNILDIADRRGLEQIKSDASVILKQLREESGGHKPRLQGSPYDAHYPLDLLWGRTLGDEVVANFDYRPTVLVEHAGIALQRNWVDENNIDFGLTGIIGGAHYVHSHLTGIAMELYGANYVMVPNAGLPASVPERRIPLHEHYFRLHAGNNTVIVNGTSHGLQPGSWKHDAHVWQDTVVNIAAEPPHLVAPISKSFSFATQRLDDTVNNAEQERTLGIVRTSPTTGYYFDLFRSLSLNENKFHDYIHHNIGDETVLTTQAGSPISLSPTDRYDNDIDDLVKSPGWRFFEDERASEATAAGVKAQFNLHFNDRSMHVFVPEGVEREYTHALAPPTREARNGYIDKKTHVLAIRQHGEAWDRPFVAVLEPSTTLESSVQTVTQLAHDGVVVGATVVSRVGDTTFTDHILCQDDPAAEFHSEALGLRFVGRYGIARVSETDGETTVTLYIGEGLSLQFGEHKLAADADHRGVKTF